MKAYIYGIKNLINNKTYIGSTKSPKTRRDSHFYNLRKGTHHSPYLQKSFNKYGKDKFAFYVIEECNTENRKERELYHITENKSHLSQFGYNTHEPDEEKFKCSESTKMKIRESHRSHFVAMDLYRVDGIFIQSFENVNDCFRYTGIPDYILHAILKGKRKSYKGFVVVHRGSSFNYTPSPKQRDMTRFYK